MTLIQEHLFSLQDKKYADFQVKLTPGITYDSIIGVRVPILRKYAKELFKSNSYNDFLTEIPHKYYDENLLHGLIISEFKDFDKCIFEMEKFLPQIDNWAVCDITSPKIFKKHKDKILPIIKKWITSSHEFTVRFGLEMLMRDFLDEDFKPEYLNLAASVKRSEYYINMMIAWYFATALAKQWETTILILQQNKLDPWVHNKTIQKACESFRVSQENKKFLKTLKINCK